MQLKSFASDLLEDAMNLAQTKAINSFSFRDCLNTLTELWGYCYEKMAQIDPGFYSKVIKLNSKLTKLPRDCKHTINVFSAIDIVGYSRKVYREAGQNDLNSPFTYRISGRDLYCWDADLRNVWLEYLPEPPMVFFTKNNRDPRIVTSQFEQFKMAYTSLVHVDVEETRYYGRYKYSLTSVTMQPTFTTEWLLNGQPTTSPIDVLNPPPGYSLKTWKPPKMYDSQITLENRKDKSEIITVMLTEDTNEKVVSIILDFPYCFVTMQDETTGEYTSWIYENLLSTPTRHKYNPFDYQGRPSNIQYYAARYNDYTGMGVLIFDGATKEVKELGWTPDTLMIYPTRVMYNYMVATMAQRFAALNGSQIMAVELALVQANNEMMKFLKKNQSTWSKMNNVTGPTWADFL